MAKLRQSKMLLLILITAILSMQWSTAHIHLAEHHDHDGNHHQHNIEAHAHQSIASPGNIIDSIHQVGDYNENIVELDYECNAQSGHKCDKQSIVLTSSHLQLNFLTKINIAEVRYTSHSRYRYLDYSTINLRAPPELS